LVALPLRQVAASGAAVEARIYDAVTAALLAKIHEPPAAVSEPVKVALPTPAVKVLRPYRFTRTQFQIALKSMEKLTKEDKK